MKEFATLANAAQMTKNASEKIPAKNGIISHFYFYAAATRISDFQVTHKSQRTTNEKR